MIRQKLLWKLIAQLICLIACGCAEKKTRIWIEPPPGYRSNERQPRKLYYQVEDMQSGKKENLMIPIEQTSENLIVESHKASSGKMESELALATQADKEIRDGKLPPDGTLSGAPTLSYLLGMEEVEGLYQNHKFTEALVKISPLIRQYPNQARLYVMQGTLFKKIGEKKMAYQAYQHAFKLDKSNPEIEEAMLRLEDELGEQ